MILPSSPLITIGITCYNAEKTIISALKSALSQSWENVEIIVVDDRSTDQSVVKLTSVIENQNNVFLYNNTENKGVAANRNKIINLAKGEFIAFFDDDDMSKPDRLQKQYNAVITNEALYGEIICHTARLQKFSNGSKRNEPVIAIGIGQEIADRVLFGKPLKTNSLGSFATCSQFARKSTYESLSGFDESFRRAEDTDFSVRAALKGICFIGIEESLVEQSMTSSDDKKLSEERKYAFKLLKKHQSYLRSIGRYWHSIHWMDAKFNYYEGRNALFILKLLTLMIIKPIKTYQRFVWALPNRRFNEKYKEYKAQNE